LFGSRAKGTFHERSDYDIAIQWDPSFPGVVWAMFCEKLREENPSLNQLDIVRLDWVSDEFKKRIIEEGKVIYDKSQTKF
jgi:predicted nucleotidyltransferase